MEELKSCELLGWSGAAGVFSSPACTTQTLGGGKSTAARYARLWLSVSIVVTIVKHPCFPFESQLVYAARLHELE